MADPIKRLAAALSTLHGARCRSAPDDAIERCQNELERAALAVVGADHAGMLPECQACHGSGRRNLTPTEAATLANLARGCELAGPDLRHRAARALIDRAVWRPGSIAADLTIDVASQVADSSRSNRHQGAFAVPLGQVRIATGRRMPLRVAA